MSFPFLQPYAGLSNSLQTAQAVGGAGGIGGWVELGRTTLGSANSSMSVSSLPDKRYYMVLTFVTSETTNSDVSARFNSDTGSNYARRGTYNGNADFTGINSTTMNWIITDSIKPDAPMLGVHYISNLASKEKLVMGEGSRSNAVTSGAGGVAGVPSRSSVAQKWVNTSNAIDEIETYVSSQFNSGSELVVLGWDPDDTHTTNFWEELASVTSTSASDLVDTGSFSQKKYLWIQIYNPAKNTGGNTYLYFNNVTTGQTHSGRSNTNGSNPTSQGTLSDYQLTSSNGSILNHDPSDPDSGTTPMFTNMFVINKADKEKLSIVHSVSGWTSTTGAGQVTARYECVNKWTNTTDAITSVQCGGLGTNGMGAGSIIKVWGAD